MPLDLRKYDQYPNEWTWVEREEKRLTEAVLATMQNAIYNTLLKVQVEQFFDIERNVKPENHEVFVRTVCEFLEYYPDYRFNRLMNRVYHDYPIRKPYNTLTDEERKEREKMDRSRRRLPAR